MWRGRGGAVPIQYSNEKNEVYEPHLLISSLHPPPFPSFLDSPTPVKLLSKKRTKTNNEKKKQNIYKRENANSSYTPYCILWGQCHIHNIILLYVRLFFAACMHREPRIPAARASIREKTTCFDVLSFFLSLCLCLLDHDHRKYACVLLLVVVGSLVGCCCSS